MKKPKPDDQLEKELRALYRESKDGTVYWPRGADPDQCEYLMRKIQGEKK